MTRPGVTGFYTESGEWRELVDPDGEATYRQLAALNRLGCLAIIVPGHAAVITKGVAAGVLSDAKQEGHW